MLILVQLPTQEIHFQYIILTMHLHRKRTCTEQHIVFEFYAEHHILFLIFICLSWISVTIFMFYVIMYEYVP